MGSVKDLTIIEPAFENKAGTGDFRFSDRYSVFDWGEMPNLINFKGTALAIMAAFNFEELEKRGIRTHYGGLVTTDLPRGAYGRDIVRFSDLHERSTGLDTMEVALAVVYEPTARQFMNRDNKPTVEYDYSFFERNRGGINNYLIPLEIIFRNGLPLGSSVFSKIEEAKQMGDPAEREKAMNKIYSSLGLSSEPKPGDMLPKPVMNYTTKLEAGDRSLTEDGAYYISGLTEEEFAKVGPLALRVNDFITEQAHKVGLEHYDGKVEMVFNKGLVICDVVGTFDENRLGLNGEQVSKEFLRQWYKKNQPEFAKACKEWKKTGEGWQERCPVKPINLPKEFSHLVSQMYMAGCNRYTGRQIFDALPLEEVMERVRPFR